jgi:hypothetical protein
MAISTARRSRWARLLGIDSNPLRRRSDRVEAGLKVALLSSFAPLAVLAAAISGHWAQALGSQELRAQSARLHVLAVLLEGVPDSHVMLGASALRQTPARWILDGRHRVGMVAALPGTPRGASVGIWVDRAGAVVSVPLTRAAVELRVIEAMALATIGVALLLWLLLSLTRGVLNRCRLASWGTAWAAVGPQWTGRR